MEIKKSWRELSLIILGVLVMVAPFVVFDTVLGWAEAILGIGVIIVGAWPFIRKIQLRSA